jgi:hypothetical protein
MWSAVLLRCKNNVKHFSVTFFFATVRPRKRQIASHISGMHFSASWANDFIREAAGVVAAYLIAPQVPRVSARETRATAQARISTDVGAN